MKRVDALVVGAGAAGLFCAAIAGARGRRVLLLDHSAKLAEKIRISGGGRCNFTNVSVTAEHFLSADPTFCRSALKGFSSSDFIALVKRHGIGFHEKHRGQLFCDESSEDIIRMLKSQCESGRVEIRQSCEVASIEKNAEGFLCHSSSGAITSQSLVIATGGLSIPKIGATDFGYRVARQFELPLVAPRPGLVPLTFDPQTWQGLESLAGLAAPVRIGTEGAAQMFDEDLLFTHRGLSGPAVLQISSFWTPGSALTIDLLPQTPLGAELKAVKDSTKQSLGGALSQWMPKRLASEWLSSQAEEGQALSQKKLAEISNRQIDTLAASIKNWRVKPSGSEGFKRAEVTCGGVATSALEPRTLAVKGVPGLYFIGEVVDVTGWLGGYNFQWAWSSGYAAGHAI